MTDGSALHSTSASTGSSDSRSSLSRTSPWTKLTPAPRRRGRLSSLPRRLRLSKATTSAPGLRSASAIAMFAPTKPAPPVTRMRPVCTPRDLIFWLRAVPLSLRADGAAGAPSEVQGLDARRALVPDQPVDPDGRVRARVQGAAPSRLGAGLSGVPDLGADRLGLLLAGAVGVGAVAGGQRAADPQGALPARDDPGIGGGGAGRHLRGDARPARARGADRALELGRVAALVAGGGCGALLPG